MPPAPLDYAQPKRRRRKGITSVLLITAALVALWHYRSPIRDRASILLAQHRCLTYTAPADRVAFEGDKTLGDALVRRDPSYRGKCQRGANIAAVATVQ